MDPKTLLDYALFHLTPTRTRCDLVIFKGGVSEKLASGLVEPFVSHLNYAKDEIPKGGYSIKLSPPKSEPFWFTKSTFQRFVRFVSTPEIVERFARLEKEIVQIENSVQSNEFTTGQPEEGPLSITNGITKHSPNASKLKGDADGTDEALQEENPKIRLQRLLETRKAVLRKEQAMAYARALAAGFELENLEDLILFADAFGASRLREACSEFKDLCMKKHSDDLWMDELAAMKAFPQPELPFLATSGIVLASDFNPSLDASSESITNQDNTYGNKDNHGASSDQTPKVPMTWPNQIPPYMFNFQNPGQQMPPYQSYPFPPMQPVPQYYPSNMHWPQNIDESDHHHNRRSSSRKKEKSQNPEEEEEELSEGSNSDTGNESEKIEKSHKKKHGRKSSKKTVVIRNINYITSNKRNEEKDGAASYDSSSGDDESVDEVSLHQQVKDVLGTLEKHHKSNSKRRGGDKGGSFVNRSNSSIDQELQIELNSDSSKGEKGNENWDAFQNLLLTEKESTTNVKTHDDALDEHLVIKSSLNGDIYGTGETMHFDSEKLQGRKTVGTDSFIVIGRTEVDEDRVNLKDFDNGEISHPNIKRRDCEGEDLLFPQRSEEPKNVSTRKLSDIGSESSVIRNGYGEDWFVANHSGKSENRELTIDMLRDSYAPSAEGDNSRVESKKTVPIDDSFMVQAHNSYDDQYNSHWKTDISMVSGIATDQQENETSDTLENKVSKSVVYEPDDLCVVLVRDSQNESVKASWSPEVDYGVEASFTEAKSKPISVEIEDKAEEKKTVNGTKKASPGSNGAVKQVRSKGLQGSLAKSKLDALAKSKKPAPLSRSLTQKSKLEKEEETRRRAEELVIERQKRIAERTAAKKGPLASPKISSPKPNTNILAKSPSINGQVKQRTRA